MSKWETKQEYKKIRSSFEWVGVVWPQLVMFEYLESFKSIEAVDGKYRSNYVCNDLPDW